MSVITPVTVAQRLIAIAKKIRDNNPTISTIPGSIPWDAFISVIATADAQQKALSYYLSLCEAMDELLALKGDVITLTLIADATGLTLQNIQDDISASFDRLGRRYGLDRLAATKASGPVKIGRGTVATKDILVTAGKLVKSSNGSQFTVTTSTTMFLNGNYWDAENSIYDVEVPVQAVTAGVAGNTPVHGITAIVTPIEGMPFVTNDSSISGGKDIETDEAYVQRLKLIWQAVGRVTPAGIELSIRNSTMVSNLYEATGNDPLRLRGPGTLDIYIKEKNRTQFTESFTGFNSTLFGGCILPSKRPLTSLVSVSSGIGFLQKDVSSLLRGSIQALDVIRFRTLPDFSSALTITYEYDQQVQDTQSVFSNDELAPSDQQEVVDPISAFETAILVRESNLVEAVYTAVIQVTPGFNAANVKAAVVSAITDYSSSLSLGQPVYIDDINKIVEAIPGVLRIQGEPSQFSPVDLSGVIDPIQPGNNEIVDLAFINIF